MHLPTLPATTIVNRYVAGESAQQLCQAYGVSYRPIDRILRAHNVPRRSAAQTATRYPKNETFFDAIDTEEKAYWLGMLYADGSVSRDKMLEMTLAIKDKPLLRRLSICLYGADRLRDYRSNAFPNTRITLCSRHVYAALQRLGCHPRKSATLLFPTSDQVPVSLVRHFVRGYFDGDGGVTVTNPHDRTPGAAISIVGTRAFLTAMQDWFVTHDIESKLYVMKHTTVVLSLHVSRVASVHRFHEVVYQNASIWLPRKRQRLLDALVPRHRASIETSAACPLLECDLPSASAPSTQGPTPRLTG